MDAEIQVDGAIDARSQEGLDGLSDSVEALRAQLQQFLETTPEPGLPISATKITLGMTIDIRTRPTPTLMISERVFRDLGALMYDRRGAFEIEVQCSLSPTLGDLVKAVYNRVPGGDRSLELAVLDSVEAAVHVRTCFTADGSYKRPVRPSDWPYEWELDSGFRLDNEFCFDNRRDGQVVQIFNRRQELGKLSVNVDADLPSAISRLIEAWKLLGCRVEYEELEFGLVRVSFPSCDIVILGNVEFADAMRCLDKRTSSDSSGRNNAGDRWLQLCGWHNGPAVHKEGEDWAIAIFEQDSGPLAEFVGLLMLEAFPVNLC